MISRVPLPVTISEAWNTIQLPSLIATGAKPATITNYRIAVACWNRLGFPALTVEAIRQSHVLQWRAAMKASGMADATVDSKWTAIRAILSSCVAEGMLPILPPTPKVKRADPREKSRPSPEQVGALYRATWAARWPHRLFAPAIFWRSIIVVAYITGLRRGDLLRLRFSEHVQPDGIRIIAQKTERFRKLIFCPWDPAGTLQRHVEAMRSHRRDVVFPLAMSRPYIAEAHRAIADAAGVPIEAATFQPWRRASIDAWTMADERAAGLIGGHDPQMPRVTRECYSSQDVRTRRAEAILREAVQRLVLPAEFAA